jgi:ubiquinone/menaquinone biosynthesis C-methylase UbiE
MSGFGIIGSRLYALFSRNPESNRLVVDLAELGADDRVLDVGCGAGGGVAAAAAAIGSDRVAAVDPSPTFAGMVRKRVPGADVRVAGAEDVPFVDASFTVIWSIASVHHWDDRDAGLATLTAKLTDGGRLLLAERLLHSPGHGITREQIRDITGLLEQLRYRSVTVVERRMRRRTLIVICARR